MRFCFRVTVHYNSCNLRFFTYRVEGLTDLFGLHLIIPINTSKMTLQKILVTQFYPVFVYVFIHIFFNGFNLTFINILQRKFPWAVLALLVVVEITSATGMKQIHYNCSIV